jgi:hypothetical protein
MAIENKRTALRISRERRRNPNYVLPEPAKQNTREEEYKPRNNTQIVYSNSNKRIKTEIKTQHTGKNLFPDYTGKYKGGTFIVAGCGSSINNFEDFSKYYVVGVNDIERILTPDFLVVVNDYRTFARGRWDWVKNSASPVIFSHLNPPGPMDRVDHLVQIKIGNRGNVNLDKMDSVDHTLNSPYMAIVIAYQLGATKIGMVGVDFTPNHFFGDTGTHKLTRNLRTIDAEYDILGKELTKRGVKIANLSFESGISSWPKMTLETFDSL